MDSPANAFDRPLQFQPIFKEKIWGGKTLQSHLGKIVPENCAIGEAWEIADCGQDQSICQTDVFSGQTLHQLTQEFGSLLIGPMHTSTAPFPLLFKFIDASEKLSVQVHPDDAYVREKKVGNFGKTECWYIINARPGSRINVGFNRAVPVKEVAKAIENNTLENLLLFHPVEAGDMFLIPAGCVHAILDGTLIYEIQQSADITYRLYDWGRLDKEGKNRQLHVSEGLEVLDTSFHTFHKITPCSMPAQSGVEHRIRTACRYFAVEEYLFSTSMHEALSKKQSLQTIALLEGGLIFTTGSGSCELKKGDSAIIPASAGQLQFEACSGTHFLVTTIPDLKKEIIAPLLACGTRPDQIIALGGNPALSDLKMFLTDQSDRGFSPSFYAQTRVPPHNQHRHGGTRP
ncbi:MAG: class I mannose-6-phosphate isomerase [Chitinivibrionales bacterium]|nr:class I mannose-6-phosphate isomerase [Chitinivibrionales bacterium]